MKIMKLRLKIFWLSLKRKLKSLFYKPRLTLSGEYFLEYSKEKQAGQIDETNYNVYYEQDFDNMAKTVVTRLYGPDYVLSDEVKGFLLDVIIKELTRVREARELDEEMQ